MSGLDDVAIFDLEGARMQDGEPLVGNLEGCKYLWCGRPGQGGEPFWKVAGLVDVPLVWKISGLVDFVRKTSD